MWALAGSLDSILGAGVVAVLVDTRATLAETNKSLCCSLEKKTGAVWLLSLVLWFVGLSSGLSACVVQAEAAVGVKSLLQAIPVRLFSARAANHSASIVGKGGQCANGDFAEVEGRHAAGCAL